MGGPGSGPRSKGGYNTVVIKNQTEFVSIKKEFPYKTDPQNNA